MSLIHNSASHPVTGGAGGGGGSGGGGRGGSTQSPIDLRTGSTITVQPQHFLRSRSLSPNEPGYRERLPKAYAVVGATQCGVVIGPMPAKKPSPRSTPTVTTHSNHSHPSHHSSSDAAPARYNSPFISTKSRPSLYQRAISETTVAVSSSASYPSSAGTSRGRSRSTANNSPASSTPVLHTSTPTPSYAGSMMPPFSPHPHHHHHRQLDPDNISGGGGGRGTPDSDCSSRCSSRASTHSNTGGERSARKGFMGKLKSVLKGESGAGTQVIYLTPEEARDRESRIKRAFYGHPVTTGGLGI